MAELIYVVCRRLQKVDGGADYDPVVNSGENGKAKMLAGENLVALQTENMGQIDALRDVADIVIVPLDEAKYNALNNELNGLIDNAAEKFDEAAKKLADAYKVMGITVNSKEMMSNMMEQAMTCGAGAGKVLNENLEIVDRASDYLTVEDDYEDEDDYDDEEEDYEDDDDYEDDEEDYDDEDDEDDEEDEDECLDDTEEDD